MRNNQATQGSVVVVQDLIKQFEKKISKSSGRQIYLAVNHLNFYVQKRACFGLLGANGAGKTTTFRMLVNDIKSTAGKIIINDKNINEFVSHSLESSLSYLMLYLFVVETRCGDRFLPTV